MLTNPSVPSNPSLKQAIATQMNIAKRDWSANKEMHTTLWRAVLVEKTMRLFLTIASKKRKFQSVNPNKGHFQSAKVIVTRMKTAVLV